MTAEAARVPVTILTGSLGAGKTTLLRRILTEKHGLRIAVIENELADSMGIESLILKQEVGGKVADGFFELSNGCLCCTQRDGLVDTLQRLMRLRDRFDRILVETSGAADPGPVASTFWTDLGEDDALLTLDGIVTVVDAVNFEADLMRPRESGAMNETERQVAFADLILVNKVDLLRKAEASGTAPSASIDEYVTGLQSRLRSINAAATIRTSVRGDVPLELLLGLHAYQTSEDGHAAAATTTAAAPDGAARAVAGPGSEAGDAPLLALGPLRAVGTAAASCASSSLHEHAHSSACAAVGCSAARTSIDGASLGAGASHVHDTRIGSWVWQQSGDAAGAGSGHALDGASRRCVLDYEALRQWLGILVWERRIPTPEDCSTGLKESSAGAASLEERSAVRAAAAAELAALGAAPPVTVLRTKGAVWLASDSAPEDDVTACSLRASGPPGAVGAVGAVDAACFLLQGVHDLFEVTPLRTGGVDASALPPIATAGAIVFIGEGVVHAAPWLKASLLACAARC